MKPLTADELRRAFLEFFSSREHTIVPSEGLIPHHPAAPMLTNAGMNQFIPVILGEEAPKSRRIADVQKCFRTVDIDIIGTTTRHCTFFEMLGNWSFGDYWKDGAIRLAWELSTKVFGFDPDQIWVTVHLDDDEAEQIWRDVIGVPAERIQRMGDDNFWSMGPTGPCGPCSELYLDRGPDFGAGGGPLHGGGERYVEFWNLVFMQYNRLDDGSLTDLPQRTIDTGAGFERLLALINDTPSVFETDVLRRLVAAGETISGRTYGADERDDVSLRILADHGRAMTFLVADGVFPSNEGRGYVLRRIIRRAVRHAFRMGVDRLVAGDLVDATIDVMGGAYPELPRQRDYLHQVIGKEEERFRQTLRRGLDLLDDLLARGDVSGEDAFFLHDTLGFPVDVTREIAEERGRTVDVAGFTDRMQAQRTRGRDAVKHVEGASDAVGAYREILDQSGPTIFTGYDETETPDARVLAVVTTERGTQIFLDRTPFYAEAGGQVGDTGTLIPASGPPIVIADTQHALPGLIAHHAAAAGSLAAGEIVAAKVDADQRDRTRRNHTATHLLHWALRQVLGDHVKQAGSLVAPDRLRFDFSHFEAVRPDELQRVEDLANAQVLSDAAVRVHEMTKADADARGAIAFFGEKYGDTVRVIEAGDASVELCGGTHVRALGQIGPIKIVSEASIGANIRRIEALTGEAALERFRADESTLRGVADLLKATPGEVPARIEKLLAQVKSLHEELDAARARQAAGEATTLAAQAADGIVAARRDGHGFDDLRRLALAVRDAGAEVAIIAGTTPDGKAGIAVAVSKEFQERGVSAGAIAAEPAKLLGGGAARNPDVVAGGGKNTAAVDAALDQARAAAAAAAGS